MRKALRALGCLGLMCLIAWLARRQGLGVSIGLYLLVPVLLGAWHGGKAWGYALSAAGALLSLTTLETDADELARARAHWEAVMHFGIYSAFTMLLDSLRGALDRERALARIDPLTGIPNARAFRDSATYEMARARRTRAPLTMAYLDLDRFKEVNDRDGHAAGDALLKEVAMLIRTHLRTTDVLARLGGDEFAVLLPETDARSAREPLDRLRRALQAAMQAKGLPVSVSIGSATFASTPPSLDEMLRQADARLYEAKRAGKDRLVQAEVP